MPQITGKKAIERGAGPLLIGAYAGAIAGIAVAYALALLVSVHWLYSIGHLACVVGFGVILGAATVQMGCRRCTLPEARLATLPMTCLVVLAVVPLAHVTGNLWLIKNVRQFGGGIQTEELWKIAVAYGGVLLVTGLSALFVVFRKPARLWAAALPYSRIVTYGAFVGVHLAVIGLIVMMPKAEANAAEGGRDNMPGTSSKVGVTASDGVEYGWRQTWSGVTGRMYSTGAWQLENEGSLDIPLVGTNGALVWFASRVLTDDIAPRWFAPVADDRSLCDVEWSVAFDGRGPVVHETTALGRVEKEFSLRVPEGAQWARLSVAVAPGCGVQVYRLDRESSNIQPPRHVLLISLDTTAQEHMGFGSSAEIETSPALERLVSEDSLAIGYTNAIGSSSSTLPAHATVWTGVNSSQHGMFEREPIMAFSDGLLTLGELARAAGTKTFGLVSHTLVGANYGYSRGMDYFARYEEPLGTRGRVVLENAFELMSEHRNDDVFMFIHLFDAHYPYTNFPKGYKKFIGDVGPRDPRELLFGELYLNGIIRSGGEDPRQRSKNVGRYGHVFLPAMPAARVAYQLGIRDVDDMLGEFFDRLREAGLFDGISLVIFADHGEEFFDHGMLTHTSLYRENIRLPLVVKVAAESNEATSLGPRRTSFVEHTFEAHTTVFRVICDLLDQPYPEYLERAATEGLGLDELLYLEDDRPAWSEMHYDCGDTVYYDLSLIENGQHAILTTLSDGVSGEIKDHYMQLFDYRNDHREQTNLFSGSDPKHLALQQRMQLRTEQIRELKFFQKTGRDLSPAEVEALHALGYVH